MKKKKKLFLLRSNGKRISDCVVYHTKETADSTTVYRHFFWSYVNSSTSLCVFTLWSVSATTMVTLHFITITLTGAVARSYNHDHWFVFVIRSQFLMNLANRLSYINDSVVEVALRTVGLFLRVFVLV